MFGANHYASWRRYFSARRSAPLHIDALEPRRLLSTGGVPDLGFGNSGVVSGYELIAPRQDGYLITNKDPQTQQHPWLLAPDGTSAGPYSGKVPPPQTVPPQNVQANGKYLVADSLAGTVTRYNADGSVDTTFGSGGKISDFTSGTSLTGFIPDNVVVSGNHIYVTGEATRHFSSPFDMNVRYVGIEAFNLNGSFDRAFGDHGAATTSDVNNPYAQTYQASIQSDGQIYAIGEQNDILVVARFNTSGTLTGEFNGYSTDQELSEPHFSPLVWEPFAGNPHGRLLLLAETMPGTLKLYRWTYSLAPDADFADDGVLQIHRATPGQQQLQLKSLFVRNDGHILVGADPYSGGGNFGAYIYSYLPGDPPHDAAHAPGAVSGFIYNDLNANGRRDAGEPPLRYWQAYADVNNNGIFDVGEPSSYTDYNGYYKIHGLLPGHYIIREVRRNGWRRTQPAGDWPAGDYSLNIAPSQLYTNKNFGNTTLGLVSGTVFLDANGNGKRDAGETGLSGWTVFVDSNRDGVLDGNDRSMLTDQSGNYHFNLPAGAYVLRVVQKAGYTLTAPASRSYHVTLGSGGIIERENFAEKH